LGSSSVNPKGSHTKSQSNTIWPADLAEEPMACSVRQFGLLSST
jgi:hypothetical protein